MFSFHIMKLVGKKTRTNREIIGFGSYFSTVDEDLRKSICVSGAIEDKDRCAYCVAANAVWSLIKYEK